MRREDLLPRGRPGFAVYKTPSRLMLSGNRLLAGSAPGVELLEQRGCDLLYDLYLLGGKILPPGARRSLAVELALPLLLLGDVLPGVLLYRTDQLSLVHDHLELRVEAFHGP